MTKRRGAKRGQTAADGDWPARLGRISIAVEVWRRRAKDVESAEAGSSLAADSVDGLRVENLIWYSMCSSSEHLGFAIDVMRATNTMYPTAYMTVARTAFVAAVNAVWVLAPSSRQERRERALVVVPWDVVNA